MKDREQCVEECIGCNKLVSDEGGNVCIAYISPKAIHRLGCGLKSNREIVEEDKKKINPLKASKRSKKKK
jgi:hypothetical protein